MKSIAIVKYVFTLVGLAMLTGAFFLYRSSTTFLAEASRTTGTVVDLVASKSDDSTVYKPVVHFTTQNNEAVEFTSNSGSNPPGYTKGETVKVLYRAAAPQDARIDGFFSLWGGALIVGGMGTLFTLIGGSIFLGGLLSARREVYLRKHGLPIQAEFQNVQLNTSLKINGRHPFRVISQWQNPVTSEVHVFESANLWFDPSGYIKDKKITVFIEAANPKRYCVDLSFLPQLAD